MYLIILLYSMCGVENLINRYSLEVKKIIELLYERPFPRKIESLFDVSSLRPSVLSLPGPP